MKIEVKSLRRYLFDKLGMDIYSSLERDLSIFSGDLKAHIYSKYDIHNVPAVKNRWVTKEELLSDLYLFGYHSEEYITWRMYVNECNFYSIYLECLKDIIRDQYNLYGVVRSAEGISDYMFCFGNKTKLSFTRDGWATFVSAALEENKSPSYYYFGQFVSKEVESGEVFGEGFKAYRG